FSATRARFLLRHPHASELWIGEKRIRNIAIHGGQILALDEIAVDDLVIVVGNMRERRPALPVAQRPASWHTVFQPAIHFDIATRIKRNSGFVNAEIIGIRNASGSREKVRAMKGLRTGGCFNGEDNFAVLLFYFL